MDLFSVFWIVWVFFFFFFKQKTAYEMLLCDWSSDVCSSDLLALPLLSRAVLVTVVVPSGKANPLDGLLLMLVTAQLSVALTVKVTLLVQTPAAVFTVRFPGQLIVGGTLSRTVTVNVHVLLLPLASVAVLVTVV